MPPTPPTAPNSHCQRRYWRYHRAATDPAAHHPGPAPGYRGLAAVVGQTSLARPACGAAWRPHRATARTDHYHRTDRRDLAGPCRPAFCPWTGLSAASDCRSASADPAAAAVWSDHQCVDDPDWTAAASPAADASDRRSSADRRTDPAIGWAAAQHLVASVVAMPVAVVAQAAVRPDSAAHLAIPHQIQGWLARLAIPD
ncbi:Uncharacterised protein [Mycobacteroides abscessus subsp. abscessus]|nr:Uncharacterised protein [Mycobacteroides abscessus subsp. abscessus]SID56849.1 Uncharacterised protein [Mycobacteroides abscessus subsp. abscessus]